MKRKRIKGRVLVKKESGQNKPESDGQRSKIREDRGPEMKMRGKIRGPEMK